MSNVGDALKRKLGPLPAWAWALVAGAGLYWLRSRGETGGAASTVGQTPSITDAAERQSPVVLEPGQQVYDPNTGQLIGGPPPTPEPKPEPEPEPPPAPPAPPAPLPSFGKTTPRLPSAVRKAVRRATAPHPRRLLAKAAKPRKAPAPKPQGRPAPKLPIRRISLALRQRPAAGRIVDHATQRVVTHPAAPPRGAARAAVTPPARAPRPARRPGQRER